MMLHPTVSAKDKHPVIKSVMIDEGIGGLIALSESDMVFLALSPIYCEVDCYVRVIPDHGSMKFRKEHVTTTTWYEFPYYGEEIFINGDEYTHTITGQYVRTETKYSDIN